MEVAFVTGNKGKLAEVTEVLSPEFKVKGVQIDLPELQGEPDEISRQKTKLAAEKAGGPVICEDTSLCFVALKGLPGPYIKWFLEKIGHEGLNNILAAYPDKSAYALCVFGYSEGPGSEPIIFEGRCYGKIVPARSSGKGFGWDPIFQPDGFDQTYAEMSSDVKNKISHRAKALEQLRAHLKSLHPAKKEKK